MLTKPLPFSDAIKQLLEKEQLPASWASAIWQSMEADFTDRAFFSANVESARFLDRAQTMIFDYLAKVKEKVKQRDGAIKEALSVSDRSAFVELMRSFMLREGMAKTSDFPTMNQKDVKQLGSLARLNLIFDTNTRQAYGFGQWKQGNTPAVLKAFPAARLIRERGVMVPRPRHAANIGEVRLKGDKWWAEFINSREIGGFGVPWGPYGFNSGANQEDVSRKDAIALGLKVEEAEPQPGKITDGLSASTSGMDPDLKKKLIDELRKGRPARSPEEAAREAAGNVRREMLGKGLEEAEASGNDELAAKYRKAIDELPVPIWRNIREDGDRIVLDS